MRLFFWACVLELEKLSSAKGSDLYGDFPSLAAVESLKDINYFAAMKERQEVVSHTDREGLCPSPCWRHLPCLGLVGKNSPKWSKLGYTEGKTTKWWCFSELDKMLQWSFRPEWEWHSPSWTAPKGSCWHFASVFSFLRRSSEACRSMQLLGLDYACCELADI